VKKIEIKVEPKRSTIEAPKPPPISQEMDLKRQQRIQNTVDRIHERFAGQFEK
jgi:hypothetical protein